MSYDYVFTYPNERYYALPKIQKPPHQRQQVLVREGVHIQLFDPGSVTVPTFANFKFTKLAGRCPFVHPFYAHMA